MKRAENSRVRSRGVVKFHYHCLYDVIRSSPGLSRKDAGLMTVKDARNGGGASSTSGTPSPLYPNSTTTTGDAGATASATGDKPNLLVGDVHEGIPLGLSKLDRDDLEVGLLQTEAMHSLRSFGYMRGP